MEKKNVLKSSHLFHFRFDVARRFAWNDIEFPGESFELALLLLPIKGMISGAWTRAAHSILFFFSLSFLKLLVSTRREARRVGNLFEARRVLHFASNVSENWSAFHWPRKRLNVARRERESLVARMN